ncbi:MULTISPECIES: hypothetical protein [unclassified Amycolatopsis]|nr:MULTISPECIES: hypothetical protein [unclassified Amycolatopsis]MDS0132230.1 hypothetical protein [Amycolatopsis sp. 505]MDS0141032.1 hypothetical protein [Amycolatopsis sp. CM201R]
MFGDVAHRLFGVHPGEPEFENRYRAEEQGILRALRGREEHFSAELIR